MTPVDLAKMLELMALALRALPADAVIPAAAAAAAAAPAPEVAVTPRSVSDWLDVHEELLGQRGYKPQTMKNRRANLAHVRRLWGAMPLAEMKPHQIASAIRGFPADRSSTARRVLAELRDAYTEAVANGWADSNPAVEIKPPKHRVKRARLTFETWQNMRTLAHAGPQRWVEPLLLLALVTGQRRGDLAKMAFTDVVDGCLRVEQQKQAGKGYGARVAIPLTLRLDAIGMTLAEVIEVCRGCGKPGPTLLRKAGGGAIEESSLSARFHEHIVAVLGAQAHVLHEWPSLHEVRSLSARLYRAQGVDVQTLLGHKNAEMTAVYEDDRGLSASQWKRVAAAPQTVNTPA